MPSLTLDIAHFLAGGMLMLSFLLLYQDRITATLNVFALQSVTLTLAVAWQAYSQGAPHLLVTALWRSWSRASSSPARCIASCGGSKSTARSSR